MLMKIIEESPGGAAGRPNPKSECRNPKQIPRIEIQRFETGDLRLFSAIWVIWHWSLFRVSCFVLRICRPSAGYLRQSAKSADDKGVYPQITQISQIPERQICVNRRNLRINRSSCPFVYFLVKLLSVALP
jgi:hypothetical protein